VVGLYITLSVDEIAPFLLPVFYGLEPRDVMDGVPHIAVTVAQGSQGNTVINRFALSSRGHDLSFCNSDRQTPYLICHWIPCTDLSQVG